MKTYLSWPIGGLLLGVTFFVALALVKPIGVSTQFVIFDGMIASLFTEGLIVESATSKSGYASSNTYLDKSGGKYAKSVEEPVNYGFVFVVAMILGGFIGRKMGAGRAPALPQVHRQRFGESALLRYILVFAAGIVVLWGARLAGGCTSGHMMSGMVQTALSGYVFAAAAFAAAIPTAVVLYRRSEGEA